MRETIKTIIKDFHASDFIKYKKRELKVPLSAGKIISIIGPRRSGKTYYLFQIMDEISKTAKKESIIYINFEDERLNLKRENLGEIIEAYYEMYPESKEIYLFFDEIQNIDGWDKFVRRMYDTVTKKIFITGSSSHLLSKEIASSLRGRTLAYNLFPLSFREFLEFKGIDWTDRHSTKNKARIRREYSLYLERGGFPETVEYNRETWKKTMQSYFDVMVYRDIIERYDVRNPKVLKDFIKICLSNTSRIISINKYYNQLKQNKYKISNNQLYEFLDYMDDSFIVLKLPKYSPSVIKQMLSYSKVYSIDTGIVNAVSFKSSEDYGRIIENAVFIELKRRDKEVYYHKDKSECDFIIKEGNKIKQAIQVTKELSEENKKREINGLMEAMQNYNITEGIILTDEQESIFKENGKKIAIKPIWKWMLEE